MGIRTVLIPLDGAETSAPVLEAGVSVAGMLGAHIAALHVRSDPRDTVPLLGEGMSVTMIEDMIQAAETEGGNRAHRARAQFEDALARHSLSESVAPSADDAGASWHEEPGREDEVIAAWGRLHDLIVVGRPTADSDVMTTLSLNAAIFESGRPVLVVPPGGGTDFGKRIAISWNGSAQSARAVSSALQLIRRAENVSVFTVSSSRTSAERAPELGRYLAWHGIKAEIETVEAGASTVGPEVMKEVAAVKADLLIMGAYTHSRMRQLILGGVTRHVLETAEIPVLMAH